MSPIRCGECKKTFVPTKADSALIARGLVQGMDAVWIDCPKCGSVRFPLKPSKAKSAKRRDKHSIERELIYRCPTSGCTGNVVFVDPPIGPFWGCGECGGEWSTRAAVIANIKLAIGRYPYRARVYVKKQGDLYPVGLDGEPKNYDKLVEREPIEEPERTSDPTRWPKGDTEVAVESKRPRRGSAVTKRAPKRGSKKAPKR